MQKVLVPTAIIVILSISGCIDFNPLANSIDKAVAVLDEAIFKLDNANADWQTILEEKRNA